MRCSLPGRRIGQEGEMRVFERITQWRRRGAVKRQREIAERERERAEAEEEYERELVAHDVGAVREDTFVASGDGAATPGLPTTTPRGIYHEFERDEEEPADTAP
jgi:hypothetical protein